MPLGLLTPAQLATVSEITGSGPVIITPWRGLIIPYAAARLGELAAAGLVTDDASPWTMISACVGAPFCTSAHGETLTVARDLALRQAQGAEVPPDPCQRLRTPLRRARTMIIASSSSMVEQPTRRYDYVSDATEIYRRSFATIRAEADLSTLPRRSAGGRGTDDPCHR